MLWLLLLVRTVAAAVLSTGTATLTNYPIPRLAIYSSSVSLYQGEAITFDASGNTLPVSGNTYTFEFEFGDGSVAVTLAAATSTTTTHIYSNPGNYRAVLRVSDGSFTAGTTFGFYSVTSTNLPAGAQYITITILPRTDCYPYSLSSTWNPSSSGYTSLTIAMTDPSAPTSATANSAVSSVFATSGPSPSAYIFNMTYGSSASATVTYQKNGWTLNLSKDWSNVSSAVVMAISPSSGISIQDCTARTTLFDVTSQPMISTFGFSMDTLSGGSYPGLALKTSNYKPNYLRIFQNSCAKKTVIGLLGTQGSGDSLGALVIATNDLFSSTILLRDLSRDATGGTTTANLNICNGVTSCTDMQIFYAAVMNYYTVFATNRGIYYISAFPVSGSSSTSNTKFYQAITGQSTLDNGASAALSGTVYLSSTANCLAASESYIFVVFSSTSALRNNLIYTTQTTIASNQWSTNIPISSISGIAATFQFVSAARFSPTSLNIYLLGIPATCTSVFTVSCSNNAVVVVHNTTKNTFTTSFTFPSTATTVTGVHCHANGIDCYIYGSELWHSIDGGNNWLQLFVFPTPDTVSKFESSHGKGNFILLTNSNNAYYGRAGNAEIVRAKTWNSKSTNLNEVVMDEMGNAFGLSLETVTAYSGTSSDYPMGFLKTITGQIRDSTSPYLKRVPIPVENLVGATDYSFPDALAPVFIGQYRVQLFSKAALFQQYHVGMMVMLSTGGKAVINSVSSGGYVADCTIITNFVASTIPASSQSLTSGAAVGDVTAPLVSDTTSTATTTTLVLGAGTWYGSDIGKTVVANQGVFLITAVSSATSATAIVIRPPLTTVNNLGSGSWSVYDFRSYTEYSYSTNAAQSITTGSITANVQTVSIPSTSPLSFSSVLKGMFLVTSDGWGLIQDVADNQNLKVTWYAAPGSSSYSDGSWSIFDVNDNYIAGQFPTLTYRTRPWNLTVNDCPWSSFSSTNTTEGSFMNYHDSLTVSATLQTANFTDNPYYPVLRSSPIISNPMIYSFSLTTNLNFFKHSSIASLILTDVGVQGYGAVALRSTYTSLACPATTVVSLQLANGCSPSRWLSVSSASGVTASFSSLPAFHTLPLNYRPPSSMGISIPTSSNIYNADPASPRYNDRYSVSKRTGTYKQCLGQSTQAACGCTDDMRQSLQVAYSDCISSVPNVLNDQDYTPVLILHDIGVSATPLTASFKLTELNGRTDYCINTGTTTICNNATLLYSTKLDPALASIVWTSGSAELYHFRASVEEKEFCSPFSVEFAVWVLLPQPRTGVILTIMSVVATAFGVLLLVAYIINNERQKNLNII